MTALVWKGMFNETFGINKWLPFDVSWQSSTIVAMFSLILVNMWLGYPYMFLVSTGALQSVPDGPQGGGVRRRRHRVEGVPQDHLPAAARRR